MTISEAKELHRRLWEWLAENPLEGKGSWPEWRDNGGSVEFVIADCFACNLSERCRDCPIEWPGGSVCIRRLDGELEVFGQWNLSKNPQERSKLAKEIAGLRWKREVKDESKQ